MDKLRIAYFLDVPHGLGGAGNLLLQQARIMKTLYEIIVIIPEDLNGNTNEEYKDRCERYELPFRTLRYATSYDFRSMDFSDIMASIDQVKKMVRDDKITFLHSVQLNVAVEYVAREYGIPHIMSAYQLSEAEFRCCPGDIYAHYHICDSDLYATRWSKQLGITSRCIRPIALLDSIQRKETNDKDRLRVLMLGSICERKNQLTAIKACELCMDSFDITLTIAGSFSDCHAQNCVKYVKEHGLSKNVTIKGFVKDVIPMLEENDCLLCTSTDESFPSSIVEALSFGLTIVSTPVAGVPEIFHDKKNAFISKNFEVDSIYESLMECKQYYMTGEIHRIQKNAEITWNNYFNRNVVREQINQFYESMYRNTSGDNKDFHRILSETNITSKMLSSVYADCAEMRKKILYHTQLRKVLQSGGIYLWGAGKMGTLACCILQMICPGLDIIAFVDREKIGIHEGIPIIKLEDMPIDTELFYGICFVEGKEKAVHMLEETGLMLNRQIWILP